MVRQSLTKREILLQTAQQLFWKHGYKRVTIEEICNLAKVSKMTYYKHFANKSDIAKAVFETIIDKSINSFKEVWYSNIPTVEKMERILLLKQEGTNEISQDFLKDFYGNTNDDVATFIAQKTAQSWDTILSDFKTAQQNGWIRKDLNLEMLFAFIQLGTTLISNEKIRMLYQTPQNMVMDLARLFVYGITPIEIHQIDNE